MTAKVVFIEWEDSSHGEAGWQAATGWDNHRPIRCYSVGRVLFENREQIVVSPHWHGGNDEDLRVQGSMRIPKSAVRDRKTLLTNALKREPRKRK